MSTVAEVGQLGQAPWGGEGDLPGELADPAEDLGQDPGFLAWCEEMDLVALVEMDLAVNSGYRPGLWAGREWEG